MKKVITYGTFDMLHRGHINLLKRAKELGDYLIVGVTSDSFDRARGKINVKQSLLERIEAVKSTNIADEIIVEEYEGQKIDDIKRYNIDIFTVGSDWIGKFDYLNEYCDVRYLDRTKGISSSSIRTEERKTIIGTFGNLTNEIKKFIDQSSYVNGVEILKFDKEYTECNYKDFLKKIDAIYVASSDIDTYKLISEALEAKKHIIAESPITINCEKTKQLFDLAKKNSCILMESIKTAYSLAFSRLVLLVKSGAIGEIVSIDGSCTSLKKNPDDKRGSMKSWGPFGLLGVFSFLGSEYVNKTIYTKKDKEGEDTYNKISLIYKNAVASINISNGIRCENDLRISGTKGYIYVPSPWWKTDYFEIRQENQDENKRYFYQLEGEGIRYMIVYFLKEIKSGRQNSYIEEDISYNISKILEDFYNGEDVVNI